MKKKLLVLSASAILASNFIFDNSASAVVDVRENPYKSEAMNIHGQRSNEDQVKVYIESLEDLIHYLSLNVHAGYDEPEYKEAYDVYQKKFMAEMEALNKIKKEQDKINKKNKSWYGNYWHNVNLPNDMYGLTYERYVHIFESLVKNRQEFAEKTREIQAQNEDLRRFDYNQKYDAGWEINQLENKIIMIGNTFKDSNPYAVLDMYNKLDVIVGISEDDRKYNAPRNKRMLEKMKEDLETVIDQFFEDAKLARPLDIQPQSDENKDNETVKQKLRDDAKAAKNNEQLRDPKTKERADKFKKAEEATKAERINKAKNAKTSQAKKSSKTKEQKTFKHKQLKKHSESNKELNIKEPSSKASDSTHVAPSTQPSQRILKQQNQENKNYSKNLPGLSGESNDFTVTHNSKPSGQSKGNSNLIEFSEDTALKNNELNQQNQTTNAPVVKETITESNTVDIDQSSFYEKSGYKYGYSVEDTSGYTERDKRVIRRNHVREAEELVNKYVNSHSYQDRIAAQAKVKTLSQEQQKRLNQQIDKIYNGQ
ncbi:secreted von Willebrand factor-binding protein precursor [Staphylococcus agnetis]|uniref:coagulase domain-containing protein n=1 Tax=Staphylococcus agnetis TaxID=985762 RepID=UPI000E001CAB|nr:coagulase domain-containing protein [Staphylococcus agnetis]SUK17561.1 secreted von Willebrand factor-binding protein precursor [Staphylococcus agnetis]